MNARERILTEVNVKEEVPPGMASEEFQTILVRLNNLFPKISLIDNWTYLKLMQDLQKEKREPVDDPYDFSYGFKAMDLNFISDFCKCLEEDKFPVMEKLNKYSDLSFIKCSKCKSKLNDPMICPKCLKQLCRKCAYNSSPFHGIVKPKNCPLCNEELGEKDFIPVSNLDLHSKPDDNLKENFSLDRIFDSIYTSQIYYCEECNKLLYPSDIIGKDIHKGHKIIKMEEYFKDLRQMFSINKNKMLFLQEDLRKRIDSLNNIYLELEKSKIKREEELKGYFESLMEKLKLKYEYLKESISKEIDTLTKISYLIDDNLINLKAKVNESDPLDFILNQRIFLKNFDALDKTFKEQSSVLKKENEKEALVLIQKKFPSSFINSTPLSFGFTKKIKIYCLKNNSSSSTHYILDLILYNENKEKISEGMFYNQNLRNSIEIYGNSGTLDIINAYPFLSMAISFPLIIFKKFDFNIKFRFIREKENQSKPFYKEVQFTLSKEKSLFFWERIIDLMELTSYGAEEKIITLEFYITGSYENFKNTFRTEDFIKFINE